MTLKEYSCEQSQSLVLAEDVERLAVTAPRMFGPSPGRSISFTEQPVELRGPEGLLVAVAKPKPVGQQSVPTPDSDSAYYRDKPID